MPGFVVQNFGGMPDRTTTHSRIDYYYSYTWEIINLFESVTGFSSGSPLIQLQSASLPTFTVNKESYFGSSLEYKFAKNISWDDIKVTWYDTAGLIDYIRDWRRQVWNENCGLQTADKYKRQSVIQTYLPNGDEKSNVEWLLINSWPSVIKYGELTYVQSEVRAVEVTITYDWARENSGANDIKLGV